MHWFLDPIKNRYADFSGRATRQEYWMFVLWYLIIYVAAIVAGAVLGIRAIMEIVTGLFLLAILVPSVALTARRLHDTNLSGWWQVVGLIPVIGGLILLILLVRSSVDEQNRFSTTDTPEAEPSAPPQTVPEAPVEENTQEGFGKQTES